MPIQMNRLLNERIGVCTSSVNVVVGTHGVFRAPVWASEGDGARGSPTMGTAVSPPSPVEQLSWPENESWGKMKIKHNSKEIELMRNNYCVPSQ